MVGAPAALTRLQARGCRSKKKKLGAAEPTLRQISVAALAVGTISMRPGAVISRQLQFLFPLRQQFTSRFGADQIDH